MIKTINVLEYYIVPLCNRNRMKVSVASLYNRNFRFYSSKGSIDMKSKITDIIINDNKGLYRQNYIINNNNNNGLDRLNYSMDKSVFNFIDFLINSKLIDFIILYQEKGVINLSPDFYLINKNQAIVLFNILDRIFSELNKLSEKGYVNDPNINIPIVAYLLIKLEIMNKDFKGSINLNVIYYNLFLLLIFKMLVILAKFIETNELDFVESDLQSDIKRLWKDVFRMINPSLSDRLKNRGLTIGLNTFTGYDSEYELESSLNKTNELLSIQLASNTSFNIKVPLINFDGIRMSDFNYGSKLEWGESSKIDLACKSIDNLIKELRLILCSDNDNLLNKLRKYLDDLLESGLEDIKLITQKDFNIYIFPKTEVVTLIKYLKDYKYEELIKDSESLNDKEHVIALLKVIKILDRIEESDEGELIDKSSGILREKSTDEDEEYETSEKMFESILRSANKHTSRITYRFNNSQSRLSITINRLLYLCMHESGADLSILSNFDELKNYLDIINRSFVTRSKPLIFDFAKSKVHFRDTVLIAPSGVNSLASIGDIYGDEYKKIDLGKHRKDSMKKLIMEDKELFELYAIRDSIITLKHANSMEEFNFSLDKLGVPLTASGIGKAYVLKEWRKEGYEGYQIRDDINIGSITAKLTPKDARSTVLINHLIPFIAGYRGGRNESMMYGLDRIENNNKRSWIDYDLTSCYPTVMSILGDPQYYKAVRIYEKTVLKMSNEQLLLNYIMLDVKFDFPEDIKYPCIPTRVDDDIDIYPLKGRSVITGSEYLVAKSMGCKLYVNEGVMIPFKRLTKKQSKKQNDKENDKVNKQSEFFIEYNNFIEVGLFTKDSIPFKTYELYRDIIYKERHTKTGDYRTMEDVLLEDYKITIDKTVLESESHKNKNNDQESNTITINKDDSNKYDLDYPTPFRKIMKELQRKRREYPKKSLLNLLYKLIANSIYGQIAMGVSGKKSFDTSTNSHVRLEGSILSNPILSSYITGFTRALIGECLHNIHLLKGRVVSVTTDGFICDIDDLENKILSMDNNNNKTLLLLYREIRKQLTTFDDSDKTDDRALEVKHEEFKGLLSWKTRGQLGLTSGGLSAMSGFQSKYLDKDFLLMYMKELFDNQIYEFEFIQSGLRSAIDIYKYGGHMISSYKDKSYNILYDNRRCIIEGNNNNNNDINKTEFLDTIPWKTVTGYEKIRVLRSLVKTPVFTGYSTQISKTYKSYIETSVRAFVKACLTDKDECRYGIPKYYFGSYEQIITFINKHELAKTLRITVSSISKLKNRRSISRAVPRNKENESFVNYLKETFPNFESDRFFREYSSEYLKQLKEAKELKELKELKEEE